MICEICTSYAGDGEDNLIRFIAGHHPSCPAFKIDKTLFLSEFKRQVDSLSSRQEQLEIPQEKEISALKIINKLHWYLSSRYFPIAPNSYVYAWESDLLAVNKESKYVTEYEVKISRGDFKADFTKFDKHMLVRDCYTYKFSSDIPNYFYYATPPGLLNKSEIPNYAGLIEVGIGIRIVKRAPMLHKEIADDKFIDKLLKKVYYKYWNR